MKLYHAFAYDGQYAEGGMNDYLGSFFTVEEAKKKVTEAKKIYGEVVVERDHDLKVVWNFQFGCWSESP